MYGPVLEGRGDFTEWRDAARAALAANIPPEKIDRLISGVQRQLETRGDEVRTSEIGEAVMALQLETTAEEMAMAVHPHPTLTEAMMEAAHAAAEGRAIHM